MTPTPPLRREFARQATPPAIPPRSAEDGYTSPAARLLADNSFPGSVAKLLSQPCLIEDLSDDDGPIFVATPLKYLRFDRDSGCCVDAPVHSRPNSRSSQRDPV